MAHPSASPSPADTQGPHVTSLPLLVVFHLRPTERAEQRRAALPRPTAAVAPFPVAINTPLPPTSPPPPIKRALPHPARAPLSPRAAKLTPCPGHRSVARAPPLSLCATLGRGKRAGGREKATIITPSSLPFSSPVPANRRRSRFPAARPHFTMVRSAQTAPHPSSLCRDRPLACLGTNRRHATLPSSALPSAKFRLHHCLIPRFIPPLASWHCRSPLRHPAVSTPPSQSRHHARSLPPVRTCAAAR